MTEQTTPNNVHVPDDWNEISAEPLDHWPEDVTKDDGPFAMKNTNNEKVVGVEYISENDLDRRVPDSEKPVWILTGPNTVLYRVDTLLKAKEKLYEYVATTTRPSGMV